MVGEGVVARPADARVSTGNSSLDAMLEGGLVAHRPYLIVGPSGTGKTTLAIQFLCEGVRRKERVLLVTLEEPPNEARVNHRGLEPELSRVDVFDAIPDIMRYERAPFKDIAAVRSAIPFAQVPFRIRQSPELASVEVTITALEQMLRTEVIRRGYTRLVIDSLTALQYFCMKGFDPVAGAQSFLRFLSDLRVTTLLTVEAPLEDIETPERMLARGEIRLFRWELDGQTVRAIGVEKFRGSSHDVRLHPYRIGPQGIDINLDVTISRDTRQIIEPIVPRVTAPVAAPPVAPLVSPVTPLIDEVRDLILLGADVASARSAIAEALAATYAGHLDQAQAQLSRVSSLVMVLVDQLSHGTGSPPPTDPTAVAAFQRVLARADSMRTGIPPTSLPPPAVLQVQLGALLSLLPGPTAAPPAPSVPAPPEAAPSPPPPVIVGVPEAPVLEPAPSPPAAEPAPAPVGPQAPAVVAPAAPAVEAMAVTTSPVREEVPAPPTVKVPASPAPRAEPPPPAAAVPEAPEVAPPPAVAPKARPTKVLPAPPKPHPPVPAPRATKPPATPAPRGGAAKAGPPPLPSTAPSWPPVPSPPAPSPPPSHPAAHAKEAPPATVEVPAHGPGGPAPKKRRKSATAGGKRAASHARTTPPHEHHAKAESPHAEAASVAPPAPSLPPVPGEATPPPATPKPRRRPARKRKAPPVVSATVEPIPPGVFGETDPGLPPPNDPERPDSAGGS